MAVRLPRPHRYDCCVAAAGLLGGVLLWGIGMGIRARPTSRSCCSTAWALLVPLVVMAACELLRRSAPRTGLLIGTAALIGDTVTWAASSP